MIAMTPTASAQVVSIPSADGKSLPELDPEVIPNVDNLVTEDDSPLDNLPSDKQQRLLIEPLYSSWTGPDKGRSFVAAANVGLFYAANSPPLVPDVFLSADIAVAEDWWAKANRSYFVWALGKLPEVVIEIVSNLQGGEADTKLVAYARIGVPYYVIYDPLELLREGVLRVFVLRGRTYEPLNVHWIPEVGLGLTLWRGQFEAKDTQWLRWCDQEGRVIPTGAERAEIQAERAEIQVERAEKLAAQLRALGIEPSA
jgi:Uma2 family endonuclease